MVIEFTLNLQPSLGVSFCVIVSICEQEKESGFSE